MGHDGSDGSPACAEPSVLTDDELDLERDRLRHASRCLRRSRDQVAEAAERAHHAGDDEMAFWLARRARALEDVDDNPLFFARLDGDLLGEGNETIYVGRRYVRDPDRDDEIVVADWRTDLARTFYRATAAEPMGVARRRRFGFSGANELTGFDDELLGISDGRLSSMVVAEIERSHVGPMRDIVATIQPEQDELVRDDAGRTLLVQGGPGTGKTAVGLHRAAYLLFEDDRLRRHGVLVVGPNEIFVRFIGRVLPSLGEEDVRHLTVTGLVTETTTPPDDDPGIATLKGDVRLAEVLRRAAQQTVTMPDDDLVVRETSPYVRIPVEDLEMIAENVVAGGTTVTRSRELMTERIVARVRRELEERGNTPTEKEAGKIARAATVRELVHRIWPTLDPEQLLPDLYCDPEALAAAGDGLLDPDEQRSLGWATRPRSTRRARWSVADRFLLDELAALAAAPRQYGHTILDEAQDLSAMQLRAVARRTRYSATVLGDLAQRTTPWGSLDWSVIGNNLGTGTAERSPRSCRRSGSKSWASASRRNCGQCSR